MLSVVIPTLNSERYISEILISLMPAVMNGMVKEVIVSDGGSKDDTFKICDEMGTVFIRGVPSRGKQLAAGGLKAEGDWLLFLHVDTALQEGWVDAIGQFMQKSEGLDRAAYFKFALDDVGLKPRLVERAVNMRSHYLGLPYGDQGLLISKIFYQKLGGYQPMALLEDVDLIRKIGSSRLFSLPSTVKTSPVRYCEEGYVKRVSRNFLCIFLYFAGVKAETISRFYERNNKNKKGC